MNYVLLFEWNWQKRTDQRNITNNKYNFGYEFNEFLKIIRAFEGV
jgi:hypothetical protein